MDIDEITPNQSRAARHSLGLSQRSIAKESGINRSQLALFEVGKYRLEAFKLLALRNCFERLNYRFDAQGDIATKIEENDALIKKLANSPVEHSLWDGEPISTGRDAIIRIMALNYQLTHILQGRMVITGDGGAKKPKTVGGLVINLLKQPPEIE
jgi:transcriptional regulator with XRE-family HTH domain